MWDEGVDTANALMPSYLSQIYLENAVWHGISSINSKGVIKVMFVKKGENIILSIIDNGIGYDRSIKGKSGSEKLHDSKGMKINQKRIDQINRQRKLNYTIEVIDLQNNGGGTEVRITMPLIYL